MFLVIWQILSLKELSRTFSTRIEHVINESTCDVKLCLKLHQEHQRLRARVCDYVIKNIYTNKQEGVQYVNQQVRGCTPNQQDVQQQPNCTPATKMYYSNQDVHQ
jgi:hypothetical protein